MIGEIDVSYGCSCPAYYHPDVGFAQAELGGDDVEVDAVAVAHVHNLSVAFAQAGVDDGCYVGVCVADVLAVVAVVRDFFAVEAFLAVAASLPYAVDADVSDGSGCQAFGVSVVGDFGPAAP